MMVIEMRNAHKEKAFDLIDDLKDLCHQKKAILCELEDVIYKCFDSFEEDDEEIEDEPGFDLRRNKSYRKNMRSHYREHDGEEMRHDRSMNEYRTRRIR